LTIFNDWLRTCYLDVKVRVFRGQCEWQIQRSRSGL